MIDSINNVVSLAVVLDGVDVDERPDDHSSGGSQRAMAIFLFQL